MIVLLHHLSVLEEEAFGYFGRRDPGRTGGRCGKIVVGRPVCKVISHHRACRGTSRGHHAGKVTSRGHRVGKATSHDHRALEAFCRHDMVSARDSHDCGHEFFLARALDF